MDSDNEFLAYLRDRPAEVGMRLSYANWLGRRDRPFEAAGQEILYATRRPPFSGHDLVLEAHRHPRSGRVAGDRMHALLHATGWASDGILALRLDSLALDEALALCRQSQVPVADRRPPLEDLLESLSRRPAEFVLPDARPVRREYVAQLSKTGDDLVQVAPVRLAGWAVPGTAEARRLGTAYAARPDVDWTCVLMGPNFYLIGRRRRDCEPAALLVLAGHPAKAPAKKRRSPKVSVPPEES